MRGGGRLNNGKEKKSNTQTIQKNIEIMQTLGELVRNKNET